MRTKALVAAAAILATFVCVLLVAISVRFFGLHGPGRIEFGTAFVGTKLIGTTSQFRSSDRLLCFRAHLSAPDQISFGEVRELFQVRVGPLWSNVAWLSAPANPANHILEYSYRLRYLASVGLKAPGEFRLLILAPLGTHQAVGTFQLLH